MPSVTQITFLTPSGYVPLVDLENHFVFHFSPLVQCTVFILLGIILLRYTIVVLPFGFSVDNMFAACTAAYLIASGIGMAAGNSWIALVSAIAATSMGTVLLVRWREYKIQAHLRQVLTLTQCRQAERKVDSSTARISRYKSCAHMRSTPPCRLHFRISRICINNRNSRT